MKIGWIGVGVMGKSMLRRLHKAGHECAVYTRTHKKAEELLQAGVAWRNSPAEVAENADLVCAMVGTPTDVREITLGEHGIVKAIKNGAKFVDFTTSSPGLAEELHANFAKLGVISLDAPVSGGDVGAKNGTLSIMVGGDRKGFDDLFPIFKLLGKTVEYQGGPGTGQNTKMVNQILIATNMIGVCEALLYAKQSGLNPKTVLKSVGGGAAASWSLNNLAPRILDDDFEPGFFVEHFIKDMRIALNEAKKMRLDLPGLKLAFDLYEKLANEYGMAKKGTQALYVLNEGPSTENGEKTKA
jgi:3-hydroxyisobutyrate dehydrogenase